MEHSPERSALNSLALLESLSRKQLITLAKKFDLKANGKNAELVARLHEHGQELDSRMKHDSLDPDEGNTTEYSMLDLEPSGEAHSAQAGSISTASSSHTLRDSAGTVLRRTSSPRHSLRDAFIAAGNAVHTTSNTLVSPTHVALIYPDLTSPALTATPRSYAPASTGGNSPALGIRIVSTPSRRATMALADAAEGMQLDDVPSEDEQVMREVPRGTTLVARLAAPSTPSSRALTPAGSTFVFGSPEAGRAHFTFGSAFDAQTDSVVSVKGLDESDNPATSGMTAAERVMAEVRARVVQERIASGGAADRPIRVGPLFDSVGTPTAGGLRRSDSAKSLAGKKEKFEGKHKREFDKMDSIATHYAAKRTASAVVGASSSSLVRSKSTASLSGSAAASASVSSSSANAERPAKRSKLASSTASVADKKLAAGLRRAGFASIPSAPRTVPGVIKKEKDTAAVRCGLIADADKVAAARKRQLELARARRKSGAAGVAMTPSRKDRRRSTQIGPQPKLSSSLGKGNPAARLFKAAFGKSDKAAPPVPAPALPMAEPASAKRAPAPATAAGKLPSSKSSFALPTATSQARARAGSTAPSELGSMSSKQADPAAKKQPGWKKFNLEESLKRPLTYVPKIGVKASSVVVGSLPRSDSATRKLSSTSASSDLAAIATANLAAGKRGHPRANGPSLSGRVANSSLLSPVRPGEEEQHATPLATAVLPATPLAPLDESTGPSMIGSFPSSAASSAAVNALSDAPEALGKQMFCFATSSAAVFASKKPALSLATTHAHLAEPAAAVLGSPIHALFSPIEPPAGARAVLQPNNFLPPNSPAAELSVTETAAPAASPVMKKKVGSGTGATPRKTVSGASRGVRDAKNRGRIEIESKARKVVAAKANGVVKK